MAKKLNVPFDVIADENGTVHYVTNNAAVSLAYEDMVRRNNGVPKTYTFYAKTFKTALHDAMSSHSLRCSALCIEHLGLNPANYNC